MPNERSQNGLGWLARWGSPGRFALVLGGGALAVFVAEALCRPDLPLGYDALQYHMGAVNILAGRGYEQSWGMDKPRVFGTPELHAFWPPGYSAFLAAVYSVTGPRPLAALVANAVLAALSVPLTYALARRWLGERRGRLAAAAYALLALTTSMGRSAYSEPLFIVLLLGTLWFATAGSSWPRLAMAGALLGAAHLVRPVTWLLPVLLVLLFVLEGSSVRRAAAKAALVAALSLLVVAPWTVRNWRQFGRFVAVSTNGGLNLWIGNNPGASGRYYFPAFPPEAAEARDEVEWDRLMSRRAVEFIRQHPGTFLRRMPAKLLYACGFGYESLPFTSGRGFLAVGVSLAASSLAAGALLAALVQGAWSLVKVWRERTREAAWPLMPPLVAAYLVSFVLVFFGLRRFLFPTYPFLGMSAAVLADWVLPRRSPGALQRRGKPCHPERSEGPFRGVDRPEIGPLLWQGSPLRKVLRFVRPPCGGRTSLRMTTWVVRARPAL